MTKKEMEMILNNLKEHKLIAGENAIWYRHYES